MYITIRTLLLLIIKRHNQITDIMSSIASPNFYIDIYNKKTIRIT